MPRFSHDVPQDPRGPAFPIVRTPPGRALRAIVTSLDLVGCFTHYYKGRTIPCEGAGCRLCMTDDPIVVRSDGKRIHQAGNHEIECDGPACEACHDGLPYRWHAYQSAYVQETALHCLFECTAQAAEHFTEYRDAHHTLRGCEFEARRYNNRPNGRILIRCRPAQLTGLILPKPPDLIKCLSILWGFPSSDVQPGRIHPEEKTRGLIHRPGPPPDNLTSTKCPPRQTAAPRKETLSDVPPRPPAD